MQKKVNLIFPHQLFRESPLLENAHDIYIIEEWLFFKQFQFHKQKIAFHRASMKSYCQYLMENNLEVKYIESSDKLSDIRNFKEEIEEKEIVQIFCIDPTDNWLEKRLRTISSEIDIKFYENPQFINTKDELSTFFRADKKSFFQTSFYKTQRKKLDVLIDHNQIPVGGKWTYDTENRKKFPKGKVPPIISYPKDSQFWHEAVEYVSQKFSENPGELSKERWYPINHEESADWYKQFLSFRFHEFGIYEDAIVKEESILNHSLISPLMNVGLLLPRDVVNQALKFGEESKVPLNSIEGFIRQIIGWREFIRGMYECKGSFSRSRNHLEFSRTIPHSFYDASTGIEPVDDTIKKVLKTGYCHHIERLMVVGNFMLLCEIDPNKVYRWFMELFIDAYDWVMVPNVYGMSQFADGGTFATKPYVGGSNYIRKMSNYAKGDWMEVWDGLFWRFVDRHRSLFTKNPRTSMMVRTFDKMDLGRRSRLMDLANKFLQQLH